MSQISFADAEHAGKRKKTRREVFLEEMELVVPWKALVKLIEPHYPVAGRGRRPYPLESILRVHLMQNWFALSDPAMEEALYEIASLRTFARLSLSEPIPDETTILNFRHLLEENDLAEDILKLVNAHLARKGLLLKRGSIVDATIIAAPSSTKNAEGKRDPDMHQTKKGEQWYFGSATCKSHGFLFHRRTYELMKPVVPPTVLYLDMRCWQRHGVKLQGQRTLRFIRCVKPRGETNSASTTAERGQG
jgi:IS5 family transposase